MRTEVEKALAYITRRSESGRRQVLVFEHVGMPEAGIQVPAGTVEHYERPEEAALREAAEETGLTGLRLIQHLGTFRYEYPFRPETHIRHIFQLEAAASPPAPWRHAVSAGVADAGLLFECYWMDLELAEQVLEVAQGTYLGPLKDGAELE